MEMIIKYTSILGRLDEDINVHSQGFQNQFTKKHIEVKGGVMERPLVTVVITSYNSEVSIEDVLNALLSQDYPLKFIEVIVVDDCSTDNTVYVVRRFMSKYRDKFYDFKLIIHDRNYGVSKARNDGIRLARGKYILILDSDVILPPNSISTMVSILKSNPEVGCCQLLLEEDVENVLMRLWKEINIGRIRNIVCCTAAAMIRREIVEKAGYYDESMGPPFSVDEDIEFGARIWRAGYRCVLLGNVIGKHLGTKRDAYLMELAGKKKASYRVTLKTYVRWLIGYLKKPHRVTWYKFLKSLPLKLRFRYILSSLFIPFTVALFLGLLIPLPHYVNILTLISAILAYLNTLREFMSYPKHIHISMFLALIACTNRFVRTIAALYALIELRLIKVR